MLVRTGSCKEIHICKYMEGKNIEQLLSAIQVLCLTVKKILDETFPTEKKNSDAQRKREKRNDPEKASWRVHSKNSAVIERLNQLPNNNKANLR